MTMSSSRIVITRRGVLASGLGTAALAWMAGGRLPTAVGNDSTSSCPCATSHLISATTFGGSGWALVTAFGITSLRRFALDAGPGGAELGDPVVSVPADCIATGIDPGGGRISIYGGQEYVVDTYTVKNSAANLTAEQLVDLPPEWRPTGDVTVEVKAWRPWVAEVDTAAGSLRPVDVTPDSGSTIIHYRVSGDHGAKELRVRSDLEGGSRVLLLVGSGAAENVEAPLHLGHDPVLVGGDGKAFAIATTAGTLSRPAGAAVDMSAPNAGFTTLRMPPVDEVLAVAAGVSGPPVLQVVADDERLLMNGSDTGPPSWETQTADSTVERAALVPVDGAASPSWAYLSSESRISVTH